jgi:AraC family transcriptional regulator of adaptative response/methylated-DNA-[protein]-cysteine methyltransferase
MLFSLPDDDTLYAALLARDPAYDGRAWVCVASTGIFCRLTCPARKPKRENCTFHDNVGACLAAGFRPCKRCAPLSSAATSDPTVRDLVAELDANPARRWTEADVAAMGYDPSTVRRAFRRQFGMTFLEMARTRRLMRGFTSLSEGEKVIDAQLAAGFSSPGAFRAAFARLLGVAPGTLRQGGPLQASWIPTPLGDMVAVASAHHLHLLEFVDRKALPAELSRLARATPGGIGLGRLPPLDQAEAELATYFEGRCPHFETPLHFGGTPFSREVWDELRRIPAGEVRSYSDIACAIGKPGAVRAVARANGANQIALLVPCHRVIGADGSLTGYGGGLWRKRRLIEIEAQYRTGARSAAE